jgi:hypothetical protein
MWSSSVIIKDSAEWNRVKRRMDGGGWRKGDGFEKIN